MCFQTASQDLGLSCGHPTRELHPWTTVSHTEHATNNRLTSTAELVKVLQARSGRIYGRPNGPSDGVPWGFWEYCVGAVRRQRIQDDYLGIFGIRRALSSYGLRRQRGEQVKPKSHGPVDNENDSSREEFISCQRTSGARVSMGLPTACGEFSAIGIRSEGDI